MLTVCLSSTEQGDARTGPSDRSNYRREGAYGDAAKKETVPPTGFAPTFTGMGRGAR